MERDLSPDEDPGNIGDPKSVKFDETNDDDQETSIEQLRETLREYQLQSSPQSEFNPRPASDTPVMSGENSPSGYSPVALSDVDDSSGSSTNEGDRRLQEETAANTAMNRKMGINPEEAVTSEGSDNGAELSATFTFAGQTRARDLSESDAASTTERLVVVMVGLPARGKSYLSKKLVRYLNWLQIPSKIFNVGSTRREKSTDGPANSPLPDQGGFAKEKKEKKTAQDANFFSPDNAQSVEMREQWAQETLDHLLDYLMNRGGCVGVFDATNTTIQRRQNVFDAVKHKTQGRAKVLYLESICNNWRLVDDNIHLKLDGPDYKNMDKAAALADFRGRLANYEKVYETISEEEEANKEFQVIQMVDVGRKVIACNIKGFIPSQIIYYFLNFNLSKRLTFIARHGESTDNINGRIGGDAPLTERGRKFSKALIKFIELKRKEFYQKQVKEYNEKLHSEYYADSQDELEPPKYLPLEVLSSMLLRSIQTAEYFPENEFTVKELRALNELGAGSFDGMTYHEIQERYPDEFAARLEDKMTYRYPGIGGESYLDVINRLKPIINEIEQTTNHMCIISHRVVCRILLAYYLNLSRDAIGELDVPLHSVYVFEPQPFGVEWKLYSYNEATDSFSDVDPSTMANSKKVREVGISYRERRYSVVPTAPRRSLRQSIGYNQSSSSSIGSGRATSGPIRIGSGTSSISSLNRARGIPGSNMGYRNPFAKR